MMKKLIALLLAVIMVLSLVACAAKEETPAPPTEEKPAETPAEETPAEEEKPAEETPAEGEHEDVTIEVWIAQVDWADAWDEMEARFEEQYPWIDVQHVGLGEDATFLQTRLNTNDLPAVVQCNNNDVMKTMVAQDLFVDLSDYPAAAYMPDSYKESYSFNGKLVGLCQGAAFSCMFYNMAILEEAGWDTIPTNWDELIQCCKDVKEKTGVAPLTTAAGKTTTSWMLFELILANVCGEEVGQGNYEEAFRNGTFDFTAYPEVVERLDEIAPYFLEGTATAQEEDVTAYMTDGLAAMCIAGNWNGGVICPGIAEAAGDESKVVASLPPFGDEGKDTWISVSPEDAFCITVDPNRTEAEQEAVDIFFNWVFEAENFQLIQNARGTVPVTTNMTDEYIVLPEAIVPVVADMGNAPFVLMGFNLWTAEFSDAANSKIQGVISGDNTAQDAVDTMWSVEQEYYKNK